MRITVRSFQPLSRTLLTDSRRSSAPLWFQVYREKSAWTRFVISNRIVFEFCFKSTFRWGEVYRTIFIIFFKMLTAFSVFVKKISLVKLIKKVALQACCNSTKCTYELVFLKLFLVNKNFSLFRFPVHVELLTIRT